MKKLKFLALILCLMLSMMVFVGCGGGVDVGTDDLEVGEVLYTYEAEDTELNGLSGPVYSGEASGYNMLCGKNTSDISSNSDVLDSISNGYFVSYLNATGIVLTFNIESDSASEDNAFYVRMGSEWGTLAVNPTNIEIRVNDVALEYDEVTVAGVQQSDDGSKSSYSSKFKDYEISTGIDLVEGSNVVEIEIINVDYGLSGINGKYGPGIDCIKIITTSVLTWEELFTADVEATVKEN